MKYFANRQTVLTPVKGNVLNKDLKTRICAGLIYHQNRFYVSLCKIQRHSHFSVFEGDNYTFNDYFQQVSY